LERTIEDLNNELYYIKNDNWLFNFLEIL
jgi:hypothetical protein